MTLTQQAKPQAMAGGSAHAWRPRETLSPRASLSPGPGGGNHCLSIQGIELKMLPTLGKCYLTESCPQPSHFAPWQYTEETLRTP